MMTSSLEFLFHQQPQSPQKVVMTEMHQVKTSLIFNDDSPFRPSSAQLAGFNLYVQSISWELLKTKSL